jgi:glycosyltransferase involved in cell wall biosynthesis
LDLPSKTPVGLKLALSQGDRLDEEEAAQELVGKGWQIVDAWKNCDTPPKYRRFIQESRGEFSCAKPSCMRLANAWISDRTLCYLASGKPVVVQYTGASSLLREGAGVFRFRSLEEATDAFQKIERNYLAHAQAARDLAEEHFDATKQIARLLELANG